MLGISLLSDSRWSLSIIPSHSLSAHVPYKTPHKHSGPSSVISPNPKRAVIRKSEVSFITVYC